MFQRFLSVPDADRALQTLRKLEKHDIRPWALTGGFAIEIHHWRLGFESTVRSLNDIDFVTDSFGCLPETLAEDFLFRHVHPLDQPGKTMLQFVDPESALRIDVFRACGTTMARTSWLDLQPGAFQFLSIEDLVARAARLTLDLAECVAVPSKHARDFLRLMALVTPADVETAWQDHRKPNHPVTFAEANSLLQDLIPAYPELLVTPHYSNETEQVCTRCRPTSVFPLADPQLVLSMLGYC